MWFFLWDPKGEQREICLFILKGGEIQYSSDGNWIVPDTTCLSLSPSFSLSLFNISLQVNLLTSGTGCHFLPIFVTTDFFLLQRLTQPRMHHKNCLCATLCSSITNFRCVHGFKTTTKKNEIEKHFPEEARTCEISYKKRFSSGIIKSRFFWPMTTQLTTLLWSSRWPDISLFSEKPLVARYSSAGNWAKSVSMCVCARASMRGSVFHGALCCWKHQSIVWVNKMH